MDCIAMCIVGKSTKHSSNAKWMMQWMTADLLKHLGYLDSEPSNSISDPKMTPDFYSTVRFVLGGAVGE
eukprot:2616045-Pyramimonas_sp.AAC.1